MQYVTEIPAASAPAPTSCLQKNKHIKSYNITILENAAIKMYCQFATYSRRLGAPQNIRHPESQYAANTTRLIHDNRSYWLNSRQQASTTTASIPDGKTDSTAWRG